jgi:hypothetical protein
MPPGDSVLTGLTGIDASAFQSETGKHPAVLGAFVTWGQSCYWAFNDAVSEHARLMLHLETSTANGSNLTPAAIAQGGGDSYLLWLADTIAAYNAPVYIRLLPEMNNANNPYSADNIDGSSRGPAYSHAAFKAAWRRVVTILRGGPVSTINAKLATLGLPAIQGKAPTETIPTSAIAFIWGPETAGTPDVPSESAASYWPGSDYVDWVGTDFYSQFPNFAGLKTFYDDYRGKPFVFAEWAMWNTDSSAFVQEFFNFIKTHKRVKMILYNNGYTASSPLLLSKYPAAAAEIHKQVAAARYLGYAPGF